MVFNYKKLRRIGLNSSIEETILAEKEQGSSKNKGGNNQSGFVNSLFSFKPSSFVGYYQSFGLKKPISIAVPLEPSSDLSGPVNERGGSSESITLLPVEPEVALCPVIIDPSDSGFGGSVSVDEPLDPGFDWIGPDEPEVAACPIIEKPWFGRYQPGSGLGGSGSFNAKNGEVSVSGLIIVCKVPDAVDADNLIQAMASFSPYTSALTDVGSTLADAPMKIQFSSLIARSDI